MSGSEKIVIGGSLALGIVLGSLGISHLPPPEATAEWLGGRGFDPSLVYGVFTGVTALGLVVQTYLTMRKGFVYGPWMSRLYKSDDPKDYRFWMRVQFFFIAVLGSLSISFFFFAI